MNILFDTNPLIYFLNKQLPPEGERLVLRGMHGGAAAYSVITRIEVLGYPSPPGKIEAARHLLDSMTEIGLSESILEQTIVLRQKYRRLKLPDAIIAATAMVFTLPVLTRNVGDFGAIVGLRVMDPFVDVLM
ncbi:MAG: type II toxin-antitoxin system VapC family toxin [Magnetococcus sp. DMHC-1]|nr:type II toxin-antitoxin system VapC family toxin [Magnetococcales bacterium]